MLYLLEVITGKHLQILYVAMMQRRQRLTRAYVARLHSVEVVPCLTVAWRQRSHACLTYNESPGIRVVCKLVLEQIRSANLWRNTSSLMKA